MKSNKILFALYQSDQGITGTKSGLTGNFAKLKATISFYSVPFIAIVERITFILSMTLIGQLEDLQWLSDDINVHTLDFAIYNDVLITDRASNKSNYFGKRTTNPAEINKYIGFFDLIRLHSHRFASEYIQSQLQLIDTLPI